MNAINQNGPGWGIDANYLTPSYLSPYRPRYQGPNGQFYPGSNPTFWSATNQLFNPFAGGGMNYGGDVLAQQRPAFDSFGYRPIDAGMGFMQHWALPGALAWSSNKLFGAASERIGARIFGGAYSAIMGGGAGSTGMMAAEGLGSLLGAAALPYAIGAAGTYGLDKAVFSPYIAQRLMNRNLRRDFQHVTFGSGGDIYTGQGLSRTMAAQIAASTSTMAAKDMTFSQEETAQISDFATRAGLLDNVDSTQLANRFKNILKQVKVVMSAANTSDFKEVIQLMAKLQDSGVATTNIGNVVSQMGGYAAMAGTSVQRLMATTGAAAQYMFGAAGITPYVGQLINAEGQGALQAGLRNGIYSNAQMARGGGVQGLTQTYDSAMMALYSSPYAMMYASNLYGGAGGRNSVLGTISAFAGQIYGASNPVEASGQIKYQNAAKLSAFMKDEGSQGAMMMIMQQAKNEGLLERNGKLGVGTLWNILESNGLNPQQIQAFIAHQQAAQDPTTATNRIKALNAFGTQQHAEYLVQQGLGYGRFNPAAQAYKMAGSWIQQKISKLEGNWSEDWANTIDRLEGKYQSFRFGAPTTAEDIDTYNKNLGPKGEVSLINTDKWGSMEKNGLRIFKGWNQATKNGGITAIEDSDYEQINKLAKEGNQYALTILSKSASVGEKRNALDQISNRLQGDYKGITSQMQFLHGADILGIQHGSQIANTRSFKGDLLSAVRDATGDKNMTSEKFFGSYNSALQTASKELLAGGSVDKDVKKALLPLLQRTHKGMTVNDISDADIEKLVQQMQGAFGDTGLYMTALNWTTLQGKSFDQRIQYAKDHHIKMVGAAAPMSNGNWRDQLNYENQQQALDQQVQKIQQAVKAGKIDFGTAANMINAIDNGQVVANFGSAVKTFSDAVDTFAGKPSSGGSAKPTKASPTMYERLGSPLIDTITSSWVWG